MVVVAGGSGGGGGDGDGLEDLAPLQPVGRPIVPGFGPSGSTFDLDSNSIVAGAQMQPPLQEREPDPEPDLVELPEAPQIHTNQEEPTNGPRFMGSHVFQSREAPPVRRTAAPDPAHDLQRLQRELLNMGGHGSEAARDAHHAAQAQRVRATHGSDEAQRERGAAAALAHIRSTGVNGGWTEAEQAADQASWARMGRLSDALQAQRLEREERQRLEREPAVGDGPTEIQNGSDTDDPDED